MNHYIYFHTEDFIWDGPFREWVLAPTRENHRVWSCWLNQHPEREQSILLARQIVLALNQIEPSITDDEINDKIKEVLSWITQ